MKNVILLCLFALLISVGFSQTQNALDFNGPNDYVNCGNDASINLTTNFTVEAWVNVPTIGIDKQIVSKGYDGTNTQWELKTTTNSGNVSFRSWNGSVVGVQSNSTLTVNVWTHIAGTFDGTTWRIYWNGTLDNSIGAAVPNQTTTESFYRGSSSWYAWYSTMDRTH